MKKSNRNTTKYLTYYLFAILTTSLIILSNSQLHATDNVKRIDPVISSFFSDGIAGELITYNICQGASVTLAPKTGSGTYMPAGYDWAHLEGKDDPREVTEAPWLML